ncbi:MAG TPA: ATP-binding cassette domain-containing protein, partial [Azospirillaceae bacterium]|nr:ATP-binding cassette domain-containing protein [Azospirillaceae bacterium]
MIRIDAVTKTFRDVRVLDALTLAIPAGQRVALVGSNGAGKTTLIRCLLGEYAFDGRLTVDGLDPRRDRSALLARVGFVPQLPPPLKMPVAELIRFVASVAGADAARVADV